MWALREALLPKLPIAAVADNAATEELNLPSKQSKDLFLLSQDISTLLLMPM